MREVRRRLFESEKFATGPMMSSSRARPSMLGELPNWEKSSLMTSSPKSNSSLRSGVSSETISWKLFRPRMLSTMNEGEFSEDSPNTFIRQGKKRVE